MCVCANLGRPPKISRQIRAVYRIKANEHQRGCKLCYENGNWWSTITKWMEFNYFVIFFFVHAQNQLNLLLMSAPSAAPSHIFLCCISALPRWLCWKDMEKKNRKWLDIRQRAQRTSAKSLNSSDSIEEEFIWWNEISNFTSQLFPLRFFLSASRSSFMLHACRLLLVKSPTCARRLTIFNFIISRHRRRSFLPPLASVIIYWVFHSRSVVFLEHFIHNTVSRSAGIWLLSDLFLPPRLCLFST